MTLERRFALIAVACLALCAPSVAYAGAAPGPESAANPGTIDLIKDAVAEYDARHFEEARALFRRALAIEPTARTLRGIGMAAFELRDYVDATRALSAALTEPRRPLTAEQREHVRALLARAQAFVGQFTLNVTPSDGQLTVDGRAITREADGTVLLSFGHHLLVLRCSTCAPVERAVDVAGGEQLTLVIAALPARLAAAGDSPARNLVASNPYAADRVAATSHIGTAAWLGGGAILATGGAVAGALWWHDRANELSTCRAAGTACHNESTVSSQRDLAFAATIGFGVAALAAGTVAAALWSRTDRSLRVALAGLGARKVVTCEIKF